MSISPVGKLVWFVVVGTLFGLFCVVLGARIRNHALLAAGVLATAGGLSLTPTAVMRRGSRR
ncbi:hypothetical protein ACFSJS_13745 [Streptomyces desertarenae]|uniref:Uncharacterized protein n=1 Tax=Streptomyces desertarenae TaxID=2666184 RepID=A0ABW4PKL1_9ACTN